MGERDGRCTAEEWLREVERPRVQTKLERDLSEAAGTRDHQGVVAWCEPYRYADAFELAGGEAPLLACLDQVSDPRNLGAVLPQRGGRGRQRSRRARARLGARSPPPSAAPRPARSSTFPSRS